MRTILQQSERDCLLACFAMTLSTYGINRQPWQLIRQTTAFESEGISAAELRALTAGYGLRLRARRGSPSEVWRALTASRETSIVHFTPHHYVVVRAARSRRKMRVHDPAIGRYDLREEDFEERASGAIFSFYPQDTALLAEQAAQTPGRYALRRVVNALGQRSHLMMLLAYLLTQVSALGLSWALRDLVDQHRSAAVSALLVTGILLASVLSVVTKVHGTAAGARSFDAKYSNRLFSSLLAKPLAYFERNSRGSLMERLSFRFAIRDAIIVSALPQIASTITSAVIIAYLALLDPWLACGILVCSAAFLAINQVLIGEQNSANVSYILRQQEFGQLVQRDLASIADMITLGVTDSTATTWGESNSRLTDSYIKVVRTTGYSQGLSSIFTFLISAGLALYSAARFQSGAMSLGTLLMIQVAGGLVASGLKDTLTLVVTLNQVRQNTDRHTEIFDSTDAQHFVDRTVASQDLIEADALTIGFGRNRVIDDVSLRIAPASRTFIVGPSGSGKSTLLKGLVGLLPHTGTIALSPGLRDHLGVAFAETRPGGESVRQALDPRGVGLTDDDGRAALEAVSLRGRVTRLPLGLDSYVSEDGTNLSNGERRRLAIAKALAAGDSLVLLDEPFIGLDEQTVRTVFRQTIGEDRSRAFLIVTHDLELIDDDDAVIFVSGSGRITGSTHASLIRRCPEYADFVGAGSVTARLQGGAGGAS